MAARAQEAATRKLAQAMKEREQMVRIMLEFEMRVKEPERFYFYT